MSITINYHLNARCNFSCKHCFIDKKRIEVSVENKLKLLTSVIRGAQAEFNDVRINFAGGEPTLNRDLPILIEHAADMGAKTSLITNGWNLLKQPKLLDSLRLDMLGISIDSFSKGTCQSIGRKIIPFNGLLEIFSRAREKGMYTKLNTVVTPYNFNELMVPLVLNLGVNRWKIFQSIPVIKNHSDKGDYFCSDMQFSIFCERNAIPDKSRTCQIIENESQIRGSYLMVSADGRFYDSLQGHYSYSDPILEAGFEKAIKQIHFDSSLFLARGGDYSLRTEAIL